MQETPNLMLPKSDLENNLPIWGGVESTINRVQDAYYDQLEYARFYDNLPLEKISDLGIEKFRFPILWEKHQPYLDKAIDWSWTEQQLKKLSVMGTEPIAGLVHHGSGPAFTNLLDPKFPYLLADYARQVASRFPYINYYTPVNEPLTTARFSGLYGLWFPHHKKDSSFLLMLLHQLKGVVLAMQEIRKINPNAKLVQTEDLGKTYSTPKLAYQAKFENIRRWLTYDLLCGKVNERHKLWKFFTKKHGISTELLTFFTENILIPDIFGFNYYVTSERYLDEDLHKYPLHTHGGNRRHRYADVEAVRIRVPQNTGIKVLLKEAWERFKQPIALTEVHLHCHREEQLRWFKHVWDNCIALKKEGVDIRAVTSWAMFGSFGWDKLLTKPHGNYEPGAFDIRNGSPRATALAAFIKDRTERNIKSISVENGSGWWCRDIRFLYPKTAVTDHMALQHINAAAPILILGRTGTLGKAFAKLCTQRAIPFVLSNRRDCDITQPESIRSALQRHKPWAVINTAGYVKVDDAESEVQQCFDANEHGPVLLANECSNRGIKLVTFSTDLVFDGKKNAPYLETDAVNPLNNYGASKAFAEKALKEIDASTLIIRTSAFFGPWDRYNFLHWVETRLKNRAEVPVAKNVHVSPTYVPDLVHAVLDLLIDNECGLWHLVNQGVYTWADLAYAVAEKYGLDADLIKPMDLEDMNLPADRPLYSALSSEKGCLLPSLENALERYFEEKISNYILPPVPELV